VQLHQLLQTILAKQAQAHHLEQLESLCRMVKETSLCGLGQNAPTPVLSSLRQFPGDYRALLAMELEPEPEPQREPEQKPEP
jgi:bidirectional [NiFe] hydrogenase diaphorase subunit